LPLTHKDNEFHYSICLAVLLLIIHFHFVALSPDSVPHQCAAPSSRTSVLHHHPAPVCCTIIPHQCVAPSSRTSVLHHHPAPVCRTGIPHQCAAPSSRTSVLPGIPHHHPAPVCCVRASGLRQHVLYVYTDGGHDFPMFKANVWLHRIAGHIFVLSVLLSTGIFF